MAPIAFWRLPIPIRVSAAPPSGGKDAAGAKRIDGLSRQSDYSSFCQNGPFSTNTTVVRGGMLKVPLARS